MCVYVQKESTSERVVGVCYRERQRERQRERERESGNAREKKVIRACKRTGMRACE